MTKLLEYIEMPQSNPQKAELDILVLWYIIMWI